VLFIIVTVLHVLAALVLCLFILLHAGRGGGLSDMFGGGMSLGGSTVAEKNLDRLTVIVATMFIATTISLGFIMKNRDTTPEPLPISTETSIPTPGEGDAGEGDTPTDVTPTPIES